MLLVAWAVVAAVMLGRAVGDLRAAAATLLEAEGVTTAGDVRAIREPLVSATELATRAVGRTDGLLVLPLRALPLSGPNVRVVDALGVAVRDTGNAAISLIDADELATAAAVRGGSADELARLGSQRMRELAPHLRFLASTLDTRIAAVDRTASTGLIAPVAEARTTFLDIVTPYGQRLAAAADLAETLPAMLGADGPRRYLVGAGSLSELRGSGGLMGAFSVLTVDDGRLSFRDFAGVDELEASRTTTAPVASPSAAHAARYDRLGGMRFWRNANLSSDVPATATVLLGLWESGGYRPVDGVILADTITFERIVERSGPITVPGVAELDERTVRPFVGLDAYDVFEDPDERKLVLGAVATAAFGRVAELVGEDDVLATIDLFAALAREGGLRIYSLDPREQAALEAVGVAGELPAVRGEFASVVVNNVAANKVDYFTSRRVEHRVRLLDDGVTASEVEVTFDNTAPGEGYPTYVLGPNATGLQAGDNLSLVTFLCGLGCDVTSSTPEATTQGTERGHPASDLRLLVPAGEQRTATFSTRTLGGWRTADGDAEVLVRHRRQPTVTEDRYRLVVEVPPGHTVRSLPEGAVLDGEAVVWEPPDRRTDLTITLRFAREEG